MRLSRFNLELEQINKSLEVLNPAMFLRERLNNHGRLVRFKTICFDHRSSCPVEQLVSQVSGWRCAQPQQVADETHALNLPFASIFHPLADRRTKWLVYLCFYCNCHCFIGNPDQSEHVTLAFSVTAWQRNLVFRNRQQEFN